MSDPLQDKLADVPGMVREKVRQYFPRISRFRLMILIGIAAAFVWVLMGARRGDA